MNYIFCIQENLNERQGKQEALEVINSLEYSDLIYLKNVFPSIEKSDSFKDYYEKNKGKLKTVSGKKTMIKTQMPDGTYRDTPYINNLNDKETAMY